MHRARTMQAMSHCAATMNARDKRSQEDTRVSGLFSKQNFMQEAGGALQEPPSHQSSGGTSNISPQHGCPQGSLEKCLVPSPASLSPPKRHHSPRTPRQVRATSATPSKH